jgi:torulene dioxygenase
MGKQFANLDEHRGPIELTVCGRIPAWAAGTVFRTGPGANEVDNTPGGTLPISHWFDGLAHTHRFDIIPEEDGLGCEVRYSSRRQADDFVSHVQKNGVRDIITFGQRADPCIGLFGKIMSARVVARTRRETKQAENIGVTVQLDVPSLEPVAPGGGVPPNTVWLGTDCHLLRQLDAESLEPIRLARQDEIHPGLDGELSCAHVQQCPATGDYISVNIKAGLPASYKVFRVSAATGKTDILATIKRFDLPMAYIHSFFLSDHFVVLRVPSSHIALDGLSILWKRNILDAMKPFHESQKNKWFVIDRVGGRGVVAEFETEAAFFFHTVNCFDKWYLDTKDGAQKWSISCDTVEYPNRNILKGLYYDVLLDRDGKAGTIWGKEECAREMLPRLKRWKFTIPMYHGFPRQRPASHLWMVQDWFKTVIGAFFRKGEAFSHKVRRKAHMVAAVFTRIPATALSALRHQLASPEAPVEEVPQRKDNEQLDGGTDSVRKDGNVMPTPESMCTINIPSPHVGELPTINPVYRGRPYRYVYSLAMSGRSTLVDTIVKTNLVSRAVLEWDNVRGHTPGEAIFIRRPGGVKEDDGVLLSVVLDGWGRKSYLLCLDALTMRETGRAEMDFAVGFGFHGVHAPNLSVTVTSEEEEEDSAGSGKIP